MCLLADQFCLHDYQTIDRCAPQEKRVFIGSDDDIYLKKKGIATLKYIIKKIFIEK